jgi:replication-associated recombination protein RarA
VTDLIAHPLTRSEIDAYLAHPSHALLIYGMAGIGKMFVARHIAAGLLGVEFDKLQTVPYYREWKPDDKGVLKLEDAHAIVAYTKLKTTGTRSLRRVIVIEQAQSLTLDAQNALLKLIEEPPIDTAILMTVTSETALLATIRSRTQSLHVRKPTKDILLQAYVSSIETNDSLERMYLLSSGLPGLLYALIHSDTQHPLAVMIQTAKDVLSADNFTRLTMIDKFSVRTDAQLLVDSLGQIARTGIATGASRNQSVTIKKWHSILSSVQVAQQQLSSSGSPKLILSDLFLHM